jgi:type VI secretion system secreted protein VgrG
MAGAQVAPLMGVAEQFGALGNSAVTGSTGVGTIVAGDVGSSPTASISNFPPSTVSPPFGLHLIEDAIVQQARIDSIAAYNALAAQGPGTVLAAQLDGAVLTSGIYSFIGGAADLAALGTLTSTVRGPSFSRWIARSRPTSFPTSPSAHSAPWTPATSASKVSPKATVTHVQWL